MPDSVGGSFPNNINIGHEHLSVIDGFTYQYQGNRPQDPLNWKISNGVSSTDPSTIGWGINQLGAMWFNTTDLMFHYWDGAQIQKAQAYPSLLDAYKSGYLLEDDFISGSTISTAIGVLGFSASGGTTTSISAIANRPGILRRDTGAVSGTVAFLMLYSSAAAIQVGIVKIIWICRLNNIDANTTCRMGATNTVALSQPVNGFYFEKLDADTNWFAVSRASGVETRVDTGVVVDVDFHTFKYESTSVAVVFSIDGRIVATITTTIPATFMDPWVSIVNSAAAAKTVDIDYFQLMTVGQSR